MKTITGIVEDKKNKKHNVLFLDYDYFGSVSKTFCQHLSLFIDKEIDEEFLKVEMDKDNYSNALKRIVFLLSKNSKTEKQAREYLLSKNYDYITTNKVIEFLKEKRFINDVLFAKSYVRFKQNIEGIKKIKYDLLSKGVQEEDILTALKELELDDEMANVSELVEKFAKKYMKGKEFTMKNKEKLIAYIYRKGFSLNDIYSCDLISKSEWVYEKD